MGNSTGSKTVAFNAAMDRHMQAYTKKTKRPIPLSNYELYLTKGKVTGIALEPVRMPIISSVAETIGEYSYKPHFEISSNHGLGDYPQITDRLAQIARTCSHIENPEECPLIKNLPDGWTVTRAWKVFSPYFRFKVPRGQTQTCYMLALPAKKHYSYHLNLFKSAMFWFK